MNHHAAVLKACRENLELLRERARTDTTAAALYNLSAAVVALSMEIHEIRAATVPAPAAART